jgi:predicted unusual protein kinase regulating ubiquinone biosynthesis (AarF/ABC1/UbiB family)
MKLFEYAKHIFLFNKLMFTLSCVIGYRKLYNEDSDYLMDTLYHDTMNNGAVVLKLAQWIITRYNIIYDSHKPTWLVKFNNIYENCDIHDIDYTRELFEGLGNNKMDELFTEFNEHPIASGSIGQVYKAKMKDGKEVAVKVMHPNMEIKSSVPILYLKSYNWTLKRLPLLYKYGLPFNLDDFFEDIKKQIDFKYEYDNLVKFNKMYKDNHLVVFPEPILKSEKILITSYEEGQFFEDVDITEYKKYKIVQLLTLFVRDSSIIKTFMHGDLHQGNWKVKKLDDSNEYALVIYDVGICVEFEEQEIKDFWYYWEMADKKKLSKLFTEAIYYYPDNMTLPQIEEGIYNNLTCYVDKPADANNTIGETLRYMNTNNIIMNSTWLNLCVIISLLEDFFKKYGIVDDSTKVDAVKTRKDVFKIFYLNYITYCETNKVFHKLKDYLKKCLDRADVKFDNLFSNLEHRLNDKNFKEIELKDDDEDDNIELSI